MSTKAHTKTRKSSKSGSGDNGPKADAKFAELTAKFVKMIEDGVADPTGWKMPWHRMTGIAPVNVTSRKRYQGGNHLYLWMVAFEAAKPGIFGTYRQWGERHCQVQRGEKGHTVIRWIAIQKRDEDGKPKVTATGAPDTFMVPKVFTVFGIWQVADVEGHEGAQAKAYARFGFGPDGADVAHKPMTEVIEDADRFFAQVGADVRYGSGMAAYSPAEDFIMLPNSTQFKDAVAFNATRGHEHIHWTGHASRLNRDGIVKFAGFGSEGYAAEELIAEMGAAFLGQRLGYAVEPRIDHANYVAHWLKAMKADPKALWRAATQAEAAANLLSKLGGLVEDLGDDEDADDEVEVPAAA